MIVGSVASIVYGEPRLTKDMDLVIEVSQSDSKTFFESFPFPEYYCPPVDILSSEFSEKGQFKILHQDSGIKIDFIIRKNSEHAKTEFSRKTKIPFWKGFEAYIASAEDVILKKLVYYREGLSEKHLRDIRGIIATTQLDQSYITKWIKILHLEEEWTKI